MEDESPVFIDVELINLEDQEDGTPETKTSAPRALSKAKLLPKRPSSAGRAFKAFNVLGISEQEMKRHKALRTLGISEQEVETSSALQLFSDSLKTQKLFSRRFSVPYLKALDRLGFTEEQILRQKALNVLGLTPTEYDDDRSRVLASMGTPIVPDGFHGEKVPAACVGSC